MNLILIKYHPSSWETFLLSFCKIFNYVYYLSLIEKTYCYVFTYKKKLKYFSFSLITMQYKVY